MHHAVTQQGEGADITSLSADQKLVVSGHREGGGRLSGNRECTRMLAALPRAGSCNMFSRNTSTTAQRAAWEAELWELRNTHSRPVLVTSDVASD